MWPLAAWLAVAAPTIEYPTLDGLPIRGAFETREDGRVVGARQPAAAPRRSAPAFVLDGRLVYRLVLGEPVLAWELDEGLSVTWVDAATGQTLDQMSRVWHARARVFPENPASTPRPRTVELATLDAEPGHPLRSETIEVYGCADTPAQTVPPWWQPGACYPVARAEADDNGDFFVDLPDIGVPAQAAARDDAYAEVAAYRTVERFFAVLEERGLPSRRCDTFTVAVNHYDLDEDGNARVVEGASYIDTCDPEVAPTLRIGQGEYADWAYDADVLYHELGHSVVLDLAPEPLRERRHAPTGILSEAGAVNEGLADYLAMSVAGDPDVGEYVSTFGLASSAGYLRSGTNTTVCPTNLIGDWHNDGRPLSAALWAMREQLGPVVDAIVFRTLPRVPPDTLLDEFGRALRDVANEMAAEGTLDAAAAGIVERALATRGLLDCDHVIDQVGLVTTGKRMVLVSTDETTVPFSPGPLQLRYRVPEGGEEVTLFFNTDSGTTETPIEASFLVKHADAPITFEYAFGDVLEVSGDWDEEIEAQSLNGHHFIARLPVEEGEILHVALANRSAAFATIGDFFVTVSDPADVEAPPEQGCGCHVDRSPPWLLLLALLAIRRRASGRRRRR